MSFCPKVWTLRRCKCTFLPFFFSFSSSFSSRLPALDVRYLQPDFFFFRSFLEVSLSRSFCALLRFASFRTDVRGMDTDCFFFVVILVLRCPSPPPLKLYECPRKGEGAFHCRTLPEVASLLQSQSVARVFLIGGAQLYSSFLAQPELGGFVLDRLLVTRISQPDFACDTFLPSSLPFSCPFTLAGRHRHLEHSPEQIQDPDQDPDQDQDQAPYSLNPPSSALYQDKDRADVQARTPNVALPQTWRKTSPSELLDWVPPLDAQPSPALRALLGSGPQGIRQNEGGVEYELQMWTRR